MAFPGFNFLTGVFTPSQEEELQQFAAYLQGYLSQQHKDTGAHSAITADSVTVAGPVVATGVGTFGGDVTANKDQNASASSGPSESSLRGAIISGGSITGPGLQLGRDADTWRWMIVANALRTGDLEFIEGPDSITFRRAMSLMQADTPTAGDYYLLPSVTGKLSIGAASGVMGAFSGVARVDGVYTRTLDTQLGLIERGRTALAGEWTSFAPAWTGTVSNPAIGNGSIAGSYAIVGKTVTFRIVINIGSLTTFGTGDWVFALPQAGGSFALSAGHAYDSSANTFYIGQLAIASSTTFSIFTHGGPFINGTVPFVWANGDVIRIAGTYEMS